MRVFTNRSGITKGWHYFQEDPDCWVSCLAMIEDNAQFDDNSDIAACEATGAGQPNVFLKWVGIMQCLQGLEGCMQR